MEHKEAEIVINGVKLSFAQSMTLRCAITDFLFTLSEQNALGNDEHGLKMTALYKARAREIERLIINR